MKVRIDTPLSQYSTLAFLALIWGSSFILMKRGLESFSSVQVAEYRLFIAFVALAPIAIRNLPRFPKSWKERFGIFVVAVAGNFFPAFLFAEAQTQLPSGITGMLNSLVPLFTLLLGVFLFRAKTSIIQVLGITIGLVGAITLIWFSHQGEQIEVPLIYPLMVVGATLCYATSVNVIKSFLSEVNAIHITAFAFLMVGPIAAIGLLSNDFAQVVVSDDKGWVNLGYLTILGVVGTAAAVLVFNQLIKFTTAIFASTVTYLIPIVAMAWGIWDGESISWQHLLGMGLILGGVYLVNRKK